MDDSTSIRPARALLSPPWLLALAVLLVNDHWLKYADVAPGWLTGKLSDLAGMLVAPVLFAVLLGVRRRAALLACHVAVGLVFAAIKLSPACAAVWSSAMGLFGYPWTIVGDATDLLALPCLALSWKLLLPHMDPEASPLVPLRRSAVAGLAALGLWSSVATTEPEPFVWEPFYSDVTGHIYLNNTSDVPLALHVRYLREELNLDCDELALDPGRLLSPEAFGDAEHWLLDPGVNLGLEFVEGGSCGALWIAGEGIEPTIVFVELSAYPFRNFPGFTQNSDDLGAGGLGLGFDGPGPAVWTGGDDIRFTPRSDTPEQPPACEPSPADSRIDWVAELPQFPTEIVALDAGPDGCFEFTLQEWAVGQDGIVPWQTPYAWYLCAPAAAVPFVVGEYIGFELMADEIGTRELTLTLVDPVDLLPAMTNGVPTRRVRLLHGGTSAQFIGPALGLEFETVVATSCPWQLEPGCATAERLAQMREVGSADPFPFGTPVIFDGSITRTMVLTHMRQRAIVDPVCSDGALILSYDIDLALVEEAG
jgi:hypothetical protein